MGMIKEFKEFAMRGNVIDMAVGIVIGVAFGKIVSVLVDKVMMPPIGVLTGGIDFADKKIVIANAVVDAAGKVTKPEVAIGWGELVNAIINFIIVAFCLFMVIKTMNRLMPKPPPPPPPGPTPDQKLLAEIRDLLARKA